MNKPAEPNIARDRSLSGVTIAFVENSKFIKRYLTRFLSSQQDIEDVAQEAYLRAYSAEKRGDINHPKAFLFRIAKNVALTELTRKSRQITDYLDESSPAPLAEAGASADDELEASQSLGLYCEAVAALPERCRQVFLLRKVHGLKHREIAERLSLSVSAVEKHLRRGALECRDYMRKRDRARESAPARDRAAG